MKKMPKVILLLETSLEYGRALLRGVARYERLHGPWSVHVEPGHLRHSLPALKASGLSGVIARITSVDEAKAIQELGCPAVVLEPSFDDPELSGAQRGFHEIITDSPAIARMAAYHLMGLGLTRFAYCGFVRCPWSDVRRREFVSYLDAHGLPCTVFAGTAGTIEHFEQDMGELKIWLRSLAFPVGVMACNDICGRQVLTACAEAGIAVPDQIAVIGVDDDELICELANPPLSSIALDCEQTGYDSAELLDRAMSVRKPKRRQVLSIHPLRAVARRSTEPIVQGDVQVAVAMRFIRDYVGNTISVPDVCKHVGAARRSLERRFGQALGYGIYEEITRCRLNRARRLLVETDLPAYRIAESAGFGGNQPMMRLFRKHEGCSPLEYRRRHLV